MARLCGISHALKCMRWCGADGEKKCEDEMAACENDEVCKGLMARMKEAGEPGHEAGGKDGGGCSFGDNT